jgi:hypothetical protein
MTSTHLRAYSLLGNRRLGEVMTDFAWAWSVLSEQIASRFDVEVDHVCSDDDREDGVCYVTVDGRIVGYVLTVERDGRETGIRPWEADKPHANDNDCKINVAAVMAQFDALIADLREVVEA